MMMNYSETPEFLRDFKKLLKKFPSLAEDLAIVKQYDIELFHLQKIDKRGIFKIENAGNSEDLQFYKIKKFACKALKGKGCKSGIRVVYAYFSNQNKVEFIEIYNKDRDDTDCNYERIKAYLKNHCFHKMKQK